MTSPCERCGQIPCRADCGGTVTYRLELRSRPWTTNAERASNRWERARLTKEWRTAFKLLAISQRIPRLEWVSVIVEPWQHGGRLQDAGGCSPAAKAAIDGIVDAGVLADDSHAYVRALTFLPPQRGHNSLVLWLRGKPASETYNLATGAK